MRCQKYVAVLLVVAFLLSACGVKNDSKSKDSSSEIDITQAESQVSGSSESESAEDGNNPSGEKNLDEVFFDRPINDEKLVNYKTRVRELLSEEYAYSEDEIVEEYYGSFDSDDSSSDRGLIFLEKEKPLALLYVSFYDGGVEVLDSWQYNLQDNEGEGSSWNSCRINGMINGMRGAADYETLLEERYGGKDNKTPYIGTATRGMASLTLSHLVIFGFIALGNFIYFYDKRKKKRGAR